MLALKKKAPTPDAPPLKSRLRWEVLLGDLSLLASLTLARFIVWRTLRTRHRERVARLKKLRLINGGGQSSSDIQALQTAGIDEKGMSQAARAKQQRQVSSEGYISNSSGELKCGT